MAKITAPLLSFGGAGTIGKAVTFASWRGTAYARQRVVPANPQTVAQTATRTVFTSGSQLWKLAPALLKAPWDRFAAGQPLLGRNAFIGRFVTDQRGEADLTGMAFSPGAKGGTPPTSISLTPGSGQIQVDFVNPAPPPGWTLESAVAAAILDQDPSAMTDFKVTADEDDVSQAQVTLTGLTSSVLYVVGAWLRWSKPDGTTAYGASISDTATPTV